MAVKCKTCGNNISRYDDKLICTNICKEAFHIACINVSVSELEDLKQSGSITEWTCNSCDKSNITPNMDSPISVADTDPQEQNIETDAEEHPMYSYLNEIKMLIKNDIMKEIQSLKDDVNALKTENKNLERKIDSTHSKILAEIQNQHNSSKDEIIKKIINIINEKSTNSKQEVALKESTNDTVSTLSTNKKVLKESTNDTISTLSTNDKQSVIYTSQPSTSETSYASKVSQERVRKTDKQIDRARTQQKVGIGQGTGQATYAHNIINKDKMNTNKKIIENQNNPTDKEGFQLVSYKKKPRIIGTASSKDDKKISSGILIKRAWLHVAGIDLNVTEDNLTNYLNDKYKRSDFLCFKLDSNNLQPSFSSFKIGADFSLLDTLEKPENWENGLRVSRFNFFRQKRYVKHRERTMSQQNQ